MIEGSNAEAFVSAAKLQHQLNWGRRKLEVVLRDAESKKEFHIATDINVIDPALRDLKRLEEVNDVLRISKDSGQGM